MTALYDEIGVGYERQRRADPRVAAQIRSALAEARTVLNVGAGAGSYEPSDLDVVAVEPSAEMISQRPEGAAPCVQSSAEALPFADESFDAAMASLTVHHWTDQETGLRELRRVARGPVVIFTFDPAFDAFWLFDYFPDVSRSDQGRMPSMQDYQSALGAVRHEVVPVPVDCTDGFLCAYWGRPEAYLDERVRRSMSPFRKIGDVSDGLRRLRGDIESGMWDAAHGHLRTTEVLDCGYRLIVTT